MSTREKILLGVFGALVIYFVSRNMDKVKSLIAGEEGLRLDAYQDTGGAWTIGYGHLIKAGEKFFPYGPVRSITKAEAEALFAADTAAAASAVARGVKVEITDNMRAALTSFAFNVGGPAFLASTLLRRLNAGDVQGAANQFDVWVYDNGVRVPGLVNRREREKAVFLS